VAAGVLAGLVGAAATSRVVTTMLFGVSPYDPVTFVGISLLFSTIAAAACWIPARRALGIDPTVALRES
jgi:ABC-type antimicrobial peptide transport system permease subunit